MGTNGMRLGAALAALAALLAAAVWASLVAADPGPLPPDQLSLKRVMISSGGVAYYEFEARVEENDKTLALPVRLDQVDDVLKSIVVFDNQGGAGTVQLPSRAPLSDIFRGLPFGPSALESGPKLIESLKGAEISVTGRERIEGRAVSVSEETARSGDDTEITRHRVAVMTAQGLRQFVLEEAESISFKDPQLQAQIETALAAMASHREGQGRTLQIRSRGESARIVTVAFVAEAPLWKSSYRITTAEGQAKAWLQGWAVLENVSGHDWRDVELTLTSGNPVTFRQALYSTYYVNRPEVPVEVLGRILPKADSGALLAGHDREADERPRGRLEKASPVPAPPPPPMAYAAPAMEAAPEDATISGGTRRPDLDSLANAAIAAQSREAATQVSFKLPGKVTVLNGQSLSVPIVNGQTSAERIALYQPSTDARHPLAAVRLTNDTGTSLPPGVVTLYERAKDGATAYVGDARMNTVPLGEVRLLAFALDQKILIDAVVKRDTEVSKVTLANGLMQASTVDQEETAYTVKNAAKEPRKLVIEHPRRPGWIVTRPDPKTVETAGDAFRVPFDLKSEATDTITVETEWPRDQSITLVDLPADQFMVYAGNARLTETQRDAFKKMADLKRALDALDGQLATARAARDRVFEEQARIRENLEAAPDKSDLQNRYLRSMNALEDESEKHKKALDGLDVQREAALKTLTDFIGTLTF